MPEINQQIKRVIDFDLCIACGACVSACPFDYLKPNFDAYRGANEVAFVEAADCTGCEAPCTRVCPSIVVNFADIDPHKREPPQRDGWIDRTYIGYSPNFQTDGKSSSGGILRALSLYALQQGTPVLTLVKSDDESIDYGPKLLTREKQMALVPGSIYHSTSFVGAIEILRESERACALVGIPCQIAGIFNYIACIEPELNKKIKFTFGIVCGWMYSYHAHDSFIANKKLEVKPTDISYRGDDKVGKLKLFSPDGVLKFDRRKFANRIDELDYRSSYSTDANRFRCRVCEDHTNLLADVVAGDAWLSRTRGKKTSIIGVRSERGQRLVDEMEASGLLKLEASSFADFIESQSANLIYGTTARKINNWLRQRGLVPPSYQFANEEKIASPGIVERAGFRLETLRRHLLRQKHYRVFWWLYLLKRLMLVASGLVAAVVRRTRGIAGR